MQYFYDGQIRRYITQTIRIFSNFMVRYGDGSLVRIPVIYGDADRQVAHIIRQNSENTINSVPRIGVYVTALDIDRERLADSTFVGKTHIRERLIDTDSDAYTNTQGRNYTVERVMPTPFKLTMKVDIWASSTEQKLQILEQILVFFNPSLELQTNDNYLDWTSLSVLNLISVNWSSANVPVGNDSPIDVATLTLDTPIWISPPAKVKHLGVITKIITSLYDSSTVDSAGYITGLGQPLIDDTVTMSNLLGTTTTTITDYNLYVQNNIATLLHPKDPANLGIAEPGEIDLEYNLASWQEVLDQHPGEFTPGSSTLVLTQPNGFEIFGTMSLDNSDSTRMIISWDSDTIFSNTGIDSQGRLDTDINYDGASSHRALSPGTFDAVIDPQTAYPGHGISNLSEGDRFLLVSDIGDVQNSDGPDGWKNLDLTDLVAKAYDIIEWTGTRWNVIFNSNDEHDTLIYQTNVFTGIQYVWNGICWAKSFEGFYDKKLWRLIL